MRRGSSKPNSGCLRAHVSLIFLRPAPSAELIELLSDVPKAVPEPRVVRHLAGSNLFRSEVDANHGAASRRHRGGRPGFRNSKSSIFMVLAPVCEARISEFRRMQSPNTWKP